MRNKKTTKIFTHDNHKTMNENQRFQHVEVSIQHIAELEDVIEKLKLATLELKRMYKNNMSWVNNNRQMCVIEKVITDHYPKVSYSCRNGFQLSENKFKREDPFIIEESVIKSDLLSRGLLFGLAKNLVFELETEKDLDDKEPNFLLGSTYSGKQSVIGGFDPIDPPQTKITEEQIKEMYDKLYDRNKRRIDLESHKKDNESIFDNHPSVGVRLENKTSFADYLREESIEKLSASIKNESVEEYLVPSKDPADRHYRSYAKDDAIEHYVYLGEKSTKGNLRIVLGLNIGENGFFMPTRKHSNFWIKLIETDRPRVQELVREIILEKNRGESKEKLDYAKIYIDDLLVNLKKLENE